MDAKDEGSSSFPEAETAQERGFNYVPECYKMPSSGRPSLNPGIADVPVVDLDGINDPTQRPPIVKHISKACQRDGFFQVVNHGISQSVLDGALSAVFSFFNLPSGEKAKFMSSDVHKPVRYGTSLRDGVDKVQFWRVFLKHYAHPLEDWISLWPDNPHDYREKMAEYAKEAQKLAVTILGAITEGLGLGPQYLNLKLEKGIQVIFDNCYPPCPQPGLALGLPPHSDYSCLTIVLQNSPGLESLDSQDRTWRVVPDLHGALQVNIGDHLEVLSNGLYKSVVHRVTLSKDKMRISIASLHSLGMDENMETAEELVDEQHPKGYRKSSFIDFLKFLAHNDYSEGKNFIDTLRIEMEKTVPN